MIEVYHAPPYTQGTHVVKVTAICEEYKCEVLIRNRGNQTGAGLIHSIMRDFENGDGIEALHSPVNDKYIDYYGATDGVCDYISQFRLYNPQGREILLDDISPYIVGVEFMSFDKREEKQ